eukprot:3953291-Lingulodinium_polyedra.AAC.1
MVCTRAAHVAPLKQRTLAASARQNAARTHVDLRAPVVGRDRERAVGTGARNAASELDPLGQSRG